MSAASDSLWATYIGEIKMGDWGFRDGQTPTFLRCECQGSPVSFGDKYGH